MDDDILIIDDDDEQGDEQESLGSWRILIVDDEPEIHQVTKVALGTFAFEKRPLSFLHAYSGKEACELMKKEDDVAMILLDVVMEHDHAGLEAAKYIRDQLKNRDVRIVLRTGQPGQAPEDKVVEDYDINDYKDKTELTTQKLKTLLRSGLRSYRDICALERSKVGLEEVIKASKDIFAKQVHLDVFAAQVAQQLQQIINSNYKQDMIESCEYYRIVDHYLENLKDDGISQEITQCVPQVQEAIKNKHHVFDDEHLIVYCHNERIPLLFHLRTKTPLDPIEQHMINIFSGNIVIALDNIRLNEVIEDNQREIMYRIGEIVETRSKESGLHVKRVALYTELLCELLGMDEDVIEEIKRASPLHDIGKVGIPDAVLNKPAKLDATEWEIMKTHTQLGHDMLQDSSLKLLKIGARIAISHHERWDGQGYPHGLSGENIPIEGRVVALADVFDALGSDRCYKKAWPLDKIMTLFKDERGKHFDPQLVDLMLSNMDRFLEIRDAYQDEIVN